MTTPVPFWKVSKTHSGRTKKEQLEKIEKRKLALKYKHCWTSPLRRSECLAFCSRSTLKALPWKNNVDEKTSCGSFSIPNRRPRFNCFLVWLPVIKAHHTAISCTTKRQCLIIIWSFRINSIRLNRVDQSKFLNCHTNIEKCYRITE